MSTEFTRRETRSLIFHLLYATESFDYESNLLELVEQFNEHFETDMPIDGEIVQVTGSIIEKRDELKQYLVPFFSNWRIGRIGCCTRIILYIALWKLEQTHKSQFVDTVPYALHPQLGSPSSN